MGTTFCLVKPEGFRHLASIQSLVRVAGFTLSHERKFVWSDPEKTFEIVQQMYRDTPERLLEATAMDFAFRPSALFEIDGEDALTRFLQLAGTHVDPNQCAEGTLRKRFGFKQSVSFFGHPYWRNAVHRPKTEEEVEFRNVLYVQGCAML